MKGAIKRKLSDVCTIIAGQSPESKYYNQDGIGLPFFQGKADFGDLYPTIRTYCSTPTKIAQKNDILLSVRAPVGATNLAPTKVCIGRGLTAIRPADCLNTKYLLLFFRYFQAELAQKGAGTTFNAITQTVVKNIEIPVPSISAQERLVSKIEELFSEIDNAVSSLKAAKQKIAAYRQSILKEAFQGKLTSKHPTIRASLNWQKHLPSLPEIPQEWKYVRLDQLGELARGKSKHRPRNDPKLFQGGKYPFIQTGEVKASNGRIRTCEKLYGEFGLSQSKLWPKGTLCITIAANIAETGFLEIEACFPDSVVGFTAQQLVLPKYIRYFILSERLKLWAFAPATAQKNINLSTLENLIIPYCDMEEQKNIINIIETKFSTCDSIECTINKTLQEAKALKQSILKRAFERGLT